jgi:hypothetical protein
MDLIAEIRQALYIGFPIKIIIRLLKAGEVKLIILYSSPLSLYGELNLLAP